MTEAAVREFDAFYARARGRLAIQLAALTGDPHEAVDHVQEAFIRAWARWDRVGALDDPEGWVRRVAYNLAVSRFRRARRTVLRDRLPDHLTDSGTAAGIEFDDDQRDLIAALRRLPEKQREAVVLHHLVDLPLDEVADWLGAPVGTVKSWLHRGRRALADQLREPLYEETTR